MRLAIVIGTRPEVVKMSPIVRAAERAGADSFILHTGQHYSRDMDEVFFEDLALPPPLLNLAVGSGAHGAQTARILERGEEALLEERPDAVLVLGDTNSTVALALAAAKLGIPVGHVEAGLRSGDRSMPEELNRIVTDHLATHLYAPTPASALTLAAEGLPASRITVTGNTIVDAVRENLPLARAKSTLLARLGLPPGRFALMTAHRQENVDVPDRLAGLVAGAADVARALDLKVLWPVHPRARLRLAEHAIDTTGLVLVDPLDYFDFLAAEASARLVLTDSGGVQEEACILRVPCVTLRENTERPETIEVGANALAGTDPARILDASLRAVSTRADWPCPFGDGRAGERIVRHAATLDEAVPALVPLASR